MKRKYFSNSILMSGTLVFTKIVEFVLIAILTRIVSTQGYGEYSLFNSWVNILSIVIGGSIGSSFGIAKKDFKEHYSRYLASCVGLSYLFLAIAFVIGFVINESWDVYYLGLIILHSFNSNTLSNYDVMLIFDEKFVKASLINILKSVFSFAAILSGVLILRNLDGGMVAIVMLFISYMVLSVFAQINMFVTTRCFYNKEYWIYAFKNSYLMIFHNLSLVVLNQMDRIMIGNILDNSYVAIYSIIYSLSVVMSILWTGVHRVWLPWLYDSFEKEKVGRISKINNYLLLTMAFLTINYCYISPEFTKLFFRAEYWDGIDMMPSILFGYFFSFLFSVFVNIEYCNKRIKWITPGTIMSAGINIVTNYLFIPIWGYKAASYTTLLSYFSLFAYHYLINRKYKYFENKVLCSIVGAMCLLLEMCAIFSDNWVVRYSVLLFFDIFSMYVINRIMKKNNIDYRCILDSFLHKQ